MLEKKIAKVVNLFVENSLIEDVQSEEYQYVMVCMLETFLTVGSILLISIFLHQFILTCGFLVFFLTLRKRTGGFHLNTFKGCYISSICIYGVVVFISKWFVDNACLRTAITIAAVLLILFIGAINHPNVCYTYDELQAAKDSARMMVILESAILLFLNLQGRNTMFLAFLSEGIVLCAVLLLVAKIVGQEVK